MRVTLSGFSLRVFVNKKPLNLEKTTSSVLFVLLLIYDDTTANQTYGEDRMYVILLARFYDIVSPLVQFDAETILLIALENMFDQGKHLALRNKNKLVQRAILKFDFASQIIVNYLYSISILNV